MLTVLLSRFEVELHESMGGVEGMLERQCLTFGICIDQVTFLAGSPPLRICPCCLNQVAYRGISAFPEVVYAPQALSVSISNCVSCLRAPHDRQGQAVLARLFTNIQCVVHL